MNDRPLVVDTFSYQNPNWVDDLENPRPCPKCGSFKRQTACRDGGKGWNPNDKAGQHLVYNTVQCKGCGILLKEHGNCRFGYDFKRE